jgi:hypothetical protein
LHRPTLSHDNILTIIHSAETAGSVSRQLRFIPAKDAALVEATK